MVRGTINLDDHLDHPLDRAVRLTNRNLEDNVKVEPSGSFLVGVVEATSLDGHALFALLLVVGTLAGWSLVGPEGMLNNTSSQCFMVVLRVVVARTNWTGLATLHRLLACSTSECVVETVGLTWHVGGGAVGTSTLLLQFLLARLACLTPLATRDRRVAVLTAATMCATATDVRSARFHTSLLQTFLPRLLPLSTLEFLVFPSALECLHP